ncbi:MAG: ComEA family DNA-binding protein, partial [Brevibacterium aurantiacum]|nr:ComEA family DNA-binding protein [Brevibacterium aurantiacum]
MAVSPDDRFAGLINSSAERGGWVPGDVFGSDSEGEDEPVEPRRVRLPILVALAVVTIAVLVIA